MLWIYLNNQGDVGCSVNVGNRIRQGNAFDVFVVLEGMQTEPSSQQWELEDIGYLKPFASAFIYVYEEGDPDISEETFTLGNPSQANAYFQSGTSYKGYKVRIPADATTFNGNGGHIGLSLLMRSGGGGQFAATADVFVEATYGKQAQPLTASDYATLIGLYQAGNVFNLGPQPNADFIDRYYGQTTAVYFSVDETSYLVFTAFDQEVGQTSQYELYFENGAYISKYRIYFIVGDTGYWSEWQEMGINQIDSVTTTSITGGTRITITLSNGAQTTFDVMDGEDGKGITEIRKSATAGLVDTYTIEYTDGSTSTFTVTNGAQGQQGPAGPTGNGIASIAYQSTAGLVDTYKITYTNGSTSTFTVTNGNGIASIAKTGSSGVVDTYTITMQNGNIATFTVTNGSNIASIAKTGTNVLVDTYTVTLTNGQTTTFQVTNGRGISSIAKTNTSGLSDTYTITYNDNTTSTFVITNGATGISGKGLKLSESMVGNSADFLAFVNQVGRENIVALQDVSGNQYQLSYVLTGTAPNETVTRVDAYNGNGTLNQGFQFNCRVLYNDDSDMVAIVDAGVASNESDALQLISDTMATLNRLSIVKATVTSTMGSLYYYGFGYSLCSHYYPLQVFSSVGGEPLYGYAKYSSNSWHIIQDNFTQFGYIEINDTYGDGNGSLTAAQVAETEKDVCFIRYIGEHHEEEMYVFIGDDPDGNGDLLFARAYPSSSLGFVGQSIIKLSDLNTANPVWAFSFNKITADIGYFELTTTGPTAGVLTTAQAEQAAKKLCIIHFQGEIYYPQTNDTSIRVYKTIPHWESGSGSVQWYCIGGKLTITLVGSQGLWSYENDYQMTVDKAPTENSTHLVTSGGVYDFGMDNFAQLGKYNGDGTGVEYADQASFIRSDREIEDPEDACPPIVFGPTGGDAEISSGFASFDYLEGNTVGWNQLVKNGNFASTSNWLSSGGSLSVTNNVGTVTSTNSYYLCGLYQTLSLLANHKYLVKATIKIVSATNQPTSIQYLTSSYTGGKIFSSPVVGTKYDIEVLSTPTANATWAAFYIYKANDSDSVVFEISNVNIIDLTAMYGAGNEPTLAQFRKDYPLPFYAYDAGSLKSANAKSVTSTMMNQFDEQWEAGGINDTTGAEETDNALVRSKGLIRVVQGEVYTYLADSDSQSHNHKIYEYDSAGNYIQKQNSYYAQANYTLDSRTCFVRLVQWNGAYAKTMFRLYYDTPNLPYAPYEADTISFPSGLDLKSAKNVKDIAYADGTGTRYVGSYTFTGQETFAKIDVGSHTFLMTTNLPLKAPANNATIANLRGDYATIPYYTGSVGAMYDNAYSNREVNAYAVRNNGALYVCDLSASTTTEIASVMAGKTIYYELATPTAFTHDGWSSQLKVDNYGTLLFAPWNNTEPIIPQPYFVKYTVNLVEWLDSAYVYTEGDPSKLALKSEVTSALAGKQDTLTFDDTPTQGSSNPVKSGGVYSAVEKVQENVGDAVEAIVKKDDLATAEMSLVGMGGVPSDAFGLATLDVFKGNSAVVNQLIPTANKSFTIATTATNPVALATGLSIPAGHTVLLMWYQDTTLTSCDRNTPYVSMGGSSTYLGPYNNWHLDKGTYTWLLTATDTITAFYFWGKTPNVNYKIDNIMLIDLTQAGLTSAEMATYEAAKAALKPKGMDVDSYIPYNAGTLTDSKPTKLYSRNAILASLPLKKIGAYTFTGQEAWNASTNNRYTCAVINSLAKPADNTTVANFFVTGSGLTLSSKNGVVNGNGYIALGDGANIFLHDTVNVTSTSQAASFMAGRTIYYELATASSTISQDVINGLVVAQYDLTLPYLKSAGNVRDESKAGGMKVGQADMSTMSFSYYADWGGASVQTSGDVASLIKKPVDNYEKANILCAYETKTFMGLSGNTGNGIASNSGGTVYVRTGSSSQPSGKFNYELATPTDFSDPISYPKYIVVEKGGSIEIVSDGCDPELSLSYLKEEGDFGYLEIDDSNGDEYGDLTAAQAKQAMKKVAFIKYITSNGIYIFTPYHDYDANAHSRNFNCIVGWEGSSETGIASQFVASSINVYDLDTDYPSWEWYETGVKVDEAPTLNSDNLVTSGGVHGAIKSASDALDAKISKNAEDIAILTEALIKKDLYETQSSTFLGMTAVPAGAMVKAYLDGFKGNSIVINEILSQVHAGASGNRGLTLSIKDNTPSKRTIVVNGTYDDTIPGAVDISGQYKKLDTTHYYLFVIEAKNAPAGFNIFNYGVSSTRHSSSYITKPDTDGVTTWQIESTNGDVYNNTEITISLIDLTQWYGAGLEPTSMSDAKTKMILARGFLDYNAGTLTDSKPTKLISRGYNLCDGQIRFGAFSDSGQWLNLNNCISSVNPIPVTGGIVYSLGQNNFTVFTQKKIIEFDKDMNFVKATYANSLTGEQAITLQSKTRFVHFTYGDSTNYGSLPSDPQFFFHLYSVNLGYKPYVAPIEYNLTLPYLKSARSVQDESKAGGEKTGKVDLGDYTPSIADASTGLFRYDLVTNSPSVDYYGIPNFLCSKYPVVNGATMASSSTDKVIGRGNQYQDPIVKDSSMANKTTTEIKTAMDGVMLNFEKSTPTDFSDPISYPEIFNVYAGGSVEVVGDGCDATTTVYFYVEA